jgi:hypothetical protein
MRKQWLRSLPSVAQLQAEGTNTFEGLQRFLKCVQTLTEERRLLRFLYVASKEL